MYTFEELQYNRQEYHTSVESYIPGFNSLCKTFSSIKHKKLKLRLDQKKLWTITYSTSSNVVQAPYFYYAREN